MDKSYVLYMMMIMTHVLLPVHVRCMTCSAPGV